jgi:putative ABC transport system substrate-binding protein
LDAIVARSATAAWHVRQATDTTSIVTVGDALVQERLVAKLARPGGTFTGVDTVEPDLVAKRLQLLQEAAPRIARVAGLRCPGGATPAGRYFDAEWREAETAAGVLGLTLVPVVVANSDQVAGALDSITRMRADGVFTFDCRFLHYREAVLSSLAGMYYLPEHVEAGGLMSYGGDRPEVFRMLAEYVGKILKGAKPADLPVQQPTKFTLLVNLKTAKTLGLSLPQSLLIRAEGI